MRHRSVIQSLALVLALPLGATDPYTIDAAHSEVTFKVSDRLFKTSGRFNKVEGTLQLDPSNLSKSSVQVRIDASSINTGVAGRDKHLRSADFFDVAQFPAITFKSTSMKDLSQGKWEVTGDISLHGITKRICFIIRNAGSEVLQDGTVTYAFVDGALKLNRSEFGIKIFPALIGDEVEITLSVVAEKSKPA